MKEGKKEEAENVKAEIASQGTKIDALSLEEKEVEV